MREKADPSVAEQAAPARRLWQRQGSLRERFGRHDWPCNRLGHVDEWPGQLGALASFVLEFPCPAALFWGEELLLVPNAGFASLTGLDCRQALGTPLQSVTLATLLDERIRGVFASGISDILEEQQFEIVAGGHARRIWYDFTLTALVDPAGQAIGVACTTADCTSRVVRSRRDRIIGEVDQILLTDTNPESLIPRCCRILAEGIGVSQVGFAEVQADQEHISVYQDWNDGRIPSVRGRWRMDDFGPEFIREMKQGATIVIPDVTTDPRTASPEVRKAYEGIGTRAILDKGLCREGRMCAMLFIHHPEPRDWQPDEVHIAEEICSRLWAAVERSHSALRLVLEQERLEAFIRAVGLVWQTDERGRLVRPQEWSRYTGRPVWAVAGEGWLDDIHPDDVEQVRGAVEAAVEAGGFYESRYRVRRRDGEWRWQMACGVPFRNTADHCTEWMGICIDITDAVQFQDAMMMMHERLFQATHASSISSLSSAMAHELNQPLAAAANFLTAAKLRLQAEGPREKALGSIDQAFESIMLAGDIIRNLRGVLEKRHSDRRRLSIAQTVRDLSSILQISHENLDGLRIRIAGDADWCFYSEVQLKQVLLNLIRNAFEATRDHAAPLVEIETAGLDRNYVLVSVTDNGPGIPAAARDKLFTPFASQGGDGLGLGLAICKTIVEHSGGKMWLADREQGTRFCFTLPRRAKLARETQAVPAEH